MYKGHDDENCPYLSDPVENFRYLMDLTNQALFNPYIPPPLPENKLVSKQKLNIGTLHLDAPNIKDLDEVARNIRPELERAIYDFDILPHIERPDCIPPEITMNFAMVGVQTDATDARGLADAIIARMRDMFVEEINRQANHAAFYKEKNGWWPWEEGRPGPHAAEIKELFPDMVRNPQDEGIYWFDEMLVCYDDSPQDQAEHAYFLEALARRGGLDKVKNMDTGLREIFRETGTRLMHDRAAAKAEAKAAADAAEWAEFIASGGKSARERREALEQAGKTVLEVAQTQETDGLGQIVQDRNTIAETLGAALPTTQEVLESALEQVKSNTVEEIQAIDDISDSSADLAAELEKIKDYGAFGGKDALPDPRRYGEIMAAVRNLEADDSLVAHLPEMAKAEADNIGTSELDRVGFLALCEMVQKWMNGTAYAISDGPEGKFDNGGQLPYMLDWDWMMKYPRFARTVKAMVRPEYLFGDKAKEKLFEILLKDGCFKDAGKDFNHIGLDWNLQRRHAFQSHPLIWDLKAIDRIPPEDRQQIIRLSRLNIDSFREFLKRAEGMVWRPGDEKYTTDGLYPVLGESTIYALAEGKVTPVSDESWRVTVTRVAFFIHDGFDFTGTQWLGNWKYSDDYKGFDLYAYEGILTNWSFQNYRARTGRGCDFRTMCKPEVVWMGNYSYEVITSNNSK